MKTDDDLVVHARAARLVHLPSAADCIGTVEMDTRGFHVEFCAPGETPFCYYGGETREVAVFKMEIDLAEAARAKIKRAQKALAEAEEALALIEPFLRRGVSPGS